MASILTWYPVAGGPLQVLEVSGRIGDVDIRPQVLGEAERTIGGSTVLTYSGSADLVRLDVGLRLEAPGTSAEATYRDRVLTFCDHVRRGGLFGFALDADTAWAGQVAGLAAGASSLSAANALSAWGAGALVADSRLVCEGAGPDWQREEVRVGSVSGPTVTLAAATIQAPTGPVDVRERYTYPALRLDADAAGAPLVESQRGLTYRLSIQARQDRPAQAAIVGQAALRGTDGIGGADPLALLGAYSGLRNDVRWTPRYDPLSRWRS